MSGWIGALSGPAASSSDSADRSSWSTWAALNGSAAPTGTDLNAFASTSSGGPSAPFQAASATPGGWHSLAHQPSSAPWTQQQFSPFAFSNAPPPSFDGFGGGATGQGASLTASQLATHVASLDAISLLQIRLHQLQLVLASGQHPPGSALAGTALDGASLEKLKQEIANTATRQQALVGQAALFVAQNGGDVKVQPAVLAFRMQQQQLQQQAQLAQTMAQGGPQPANATHPIANLSPQQIGGLAYNGFPPNYPFFNAGSDSNVNLIGGQQSAPPLSVNSIAGGSTSMMNAPPQPSTPTPAAAASLPPGLQAAMKARALAAAKSQAAQAAAANKAKAAPKAATKKTSPGTSPQESGSPQGEGLNTDGRTIAGLPRPKPSTSANNPTALLAEAVQGMPSLAELHAQLKPEQFHQSLKHVLAKEGVQHKDPVQIEGRDVALWEMWQVVMVQGHGGETCDAHASWAQMASYLRLPPTPTAQDELKRQYHAILGTYEKKWSGALLRQRDAMRLERGGSSGSPNSGNGGSPPTNQLPQHRAAPAVGVPLGVPANLWARTGVLGSVGAQDVNRFEEIAEDDEERSDRKRKEPKKKSSAPSSSIPPPPPTSAAPPLLSATADQLSTAFEPIPGLATDTLSSLTAFGFDPNQSFGLSTDGGFSTGLTPDPTDPMLFGGGGSGFTPGASGASDMFGQNFDFDQFLANSGDPAGSLSGEFGINTNQYQSWS